MLIMLFRHGEAVDASEVGGNDEARVLTPKGREVVRRAGKGIKALGLIPTVIVTSPLPRATETAHALTSVLGKDIPIHERDELKPGADPGTIVGWIEGDTETGPLGPVASDAIMVVGHNPDLETLVAYLIAESGQGRVSLKKAGLAIIDSGRPLGQGTGVLQSLLTAKQLDALAR